ncbi:MAG: LytTR family DNA-binding domain-containing protein [Pseudomonadota bacterium]
MNKVPPKALIVMISACLLAVVLALVEAELPADTAFYQALPLWLTIVCTTAFLLTTIGDAISRLVVDVRLPSFLRTSLAGAITITLITIPAALMCLPIDSLQPDGDSLFEVSAANTPLSALFWNWFDQYLNLLPAIFGFWLFIRGLDLAFSGDPNSSALQRISSSQPSASPPETAADLDGKPSERKSSPLERRFPEIAGRTLIAIEADEHYVRLHTDAGSKHVLYRFRDALKDVEELAGLRVHRSWWVAEDAVESLEPTASGFELMLKGGLIAPVSQTYRRDVQRAIEARLR